MEIYTCFVEACALIGSHSSTSAMLWRCIYQFLVAVETVLAGTVRIVRTLCGSVKCRSMWLIKEARKSVQRSQHMQTLALLEAYRSMNATDPGTTYMRILDWPRAPDGTELHLITWPVLSLYTSAMTQMRSGKQNVEDIDACCT